MIADHASAQAIGYCNKGLRPWLQHHGVSWEDFRKNGVTTEFLISTGDAMAIKWARYVEMLHYGV